jgi:hypothetical protein
MAAKRTEPAEPPGETVELEHRTAAGGMVWKLLSVGSTLVATRLAADLAQRGWKLTTGRNVPARGDYEHARSRDVVLFTALSSLLVSGARVAAERGAVEYYRKSTGHLPKALEDEQTKVVDAKAARKLQRRKARADYRVQKAINRAAS